ncbi:hypothetical protein PCURB6_29670 [Paenibacillus curdlanolyticus]|nr:hypothetical protein PCURB6_29670 [Paenibacillus curdlanolyticus]
MIHTLLLITMAVVAAMMIRLEWSSLVNARLKAVFLTILIFSYTIAVVMTFNPDMPGPLQLWEMLVDPYISYWIPS